MRRKRTFIFLNTFSILFLAVILAFGQKSSARTQSRARTHRHRASASKAQPKSDFVKLFERLRGQGATVKRDEKNDVTQPFFSVPGRVLLINGEGVQVFEYKSVAAARAEAQLVNSTGTTIGTSKPAWMAPPHFYRSGKLIVLYVGDSAQVKSLLEGVLGPQFAGG